MEWKAFDSLQEFVEACKQIDEWREIEGADWNEEIGALREVTAELIEDPPMLLFDRIKGYPAGFRVVGLLMSSYKRGALALGLPLHLPRGELNRLAAQKLKDIKPIPPVEVTTGPVMENVMSGNEVDLWRFPVPRFHAMDGGRYIGTGDSLINRDPETGYINVGTYRMQVHESNLLGLWMSPGQHGRQICQRHWDQGKSCPVVAVFGEDPLSFMVSHSKIPWGHTELEQIGGLRGRPLEVIKGPITGLPIPAHAEIAIEGEVPPPKEEARDEGPFGEWPGYYSGGNHWYGGTPTRDSGQGYLSSKQSYHSRGRAHVAWSASRWIIKWCRPRWGRRPGSCRDSRCGGRGEPHGVYSSSSVIRDTRSRRLVQWHR